MKIFKQLKTIAIFTLVAFSFGCVTPYTALAYHESAWGEGGTDATGTPNPGDAQDHPESVQGRPTGGPLDQGTKSEKAPPVDKSQKTKCPEQPTAADPVALHNGEFYYNCSDLYIPGRGLDVAINHLYRSGKVYNSQFGPGWMMSYYYRIRYLSDGNVLVIQGENGRKDEFTYSSGTYTPPKGVFEELVQNGDGTWTLTKSHGTAYDFDVDGKLTSITDRNGNQITFSYASTATAIYSYPFFPINTTLTSPSIVGYEYKLETITDTVGRDIDFTYNADGKLDKITDYAGREVKFTYDSNTGDLLEIKKPATTQYPSGVTRKFTYNSNHKMLTVEDQKGQVFLTNRYNSDGLVDEQDLGSGTYEFSYGVNTTTVTDRKGYVTTYTFNNDQLVTKKEVFTDGLRTGDPASFITTYTYDTEFQTTSITYPEGNGIKYTYDITKSDRRARGNLLKIRRKADMAVADSATNDLITTFTYESNYNQVKTLKDPKGNTYTYTYDYQLLVSDPRYATKGNLVTIEKPTVNSLTPTIDFTYNGYGQVIEYEDPNGNIVEYTYFDSTTGYLKEIKQDPSGINAVTALTYDTYGNVDTVTDANNHVVDFDYNELHWLVKVTNALDYETKFTHDKNGNITKIERQANDPVTVWQTTIYTYDNRNNVKTVTDPLNRVTTYNYDLGENVSSIVDAESNTTTYEYDERDLLFKHKDANTPQGITQYDYDKNGNLEMITDAEDNETTYAYDGFDRRITKTYDDLSKSEYEYDKNSNLKKHTTPSGNDIDYTYDALNRRLTKSFESDSDLDVTYTYDVGSRMKTADNLASEVDYVYDALNRVKETTQRINANDFTVEFEYDDVGNRKQVTYPGGKVVDYEYDDHNRMTDIDVDSSELVDYEYDPLDRRKEKSFISTNLPIATYAYDIANQLKTLTNETLPSTKVSEFAYTYDDVSNRKTMNVTGSLATTGTFTYAYNDIYELTGVSGADSHSYAYDNVGNRTTVDSVSYTSNALNQYSQVASTSFYYDGNDNLSDDGTNEYTYDESNRLLTFTDGTDSASYEYDAFNRRVSKTVNGTTIYYVYDGQEVIEEYNSSNVLQADYVMGAGLDEVLTMTRNSTTYYYHYDGLNSVRNITNSSGTTLESYTYDPYGNIISSLSSIGNPYYFTGRRYDTESGVYYYRARMYDPEIGRFLQRDPLGYYDSMNLYEYVGSNPINWIDPYGLKIKFDRDAFIDYLKPGGWAKKTGNMIGGAVGAIAGFELGKWGVGGLALALGASVPVAFGLAAAGAFAGGYLLGGALAELGGELLEPLDRKPICEDGVCYDINPDEYMCDVIDGEPCVEEPEEPDMCLTE